MKAEFPIYIYVVDFLGKLWGWLIKSVLVFRNKVYLWYLEKDCNAIVSRYSCIQQSELIFEGHIPHAIWILWMQGDYSDNEAVSFCINHVRQFKEFSVNIVTKFNISEYIDISDILPLFDVGVISLPFLSDIVRMRLLRKYGGIWMDASVFIMNEQKLIDSLSHAVFFSIHKTYKKWEFVSEGKYTGFFLASIPNNPFFAYCDDCLTYFIKKHNRLLDYFQIDYTIMLGYKRIPFIHNLIENLPKTNPEVDFLAKNLLGKFDSSRWNNVCQSTNIFKLSAHKTKIVNDIRGYETYWQHITDELLSTTK